MTASEYAALSHAEATSYQRSGSFTNFFPVCVSVISSAFFTSGAAGGVTAGVVAPLVVVGTAVAAGGAADMISSSFGFQCLCWDYIFRFRKEKLRSVYEPMTVRKWPLAV
jgi:hypothetical protein